MSKRQALLILVLASTFLNLILLLFNIGAFSMPERKPKIEAQGLKEISEMRVGEQVSKAGYKIKFSNPRYEFDESSFMNSFKVDGQIQNDSFKPMVRLIANCDIIDKDEIVMAGSGARIDADEDHVDVGKKMDFTIVTFLEIDYAKKSQTFVDDRNLPGGHVSLFPNRKVNSCSFTPTGSYDPNISVKVNFN